MTDKVCVGAITGAFGVRGELRLKSFCADPAALGDYGPVTLDNGQTGTVTITRSVKGGFAARMSHVSTKDDADALRGQRLYVPRDRLPDLGDDEYYHADLIGLTVYDPGGAEVGRLRAIHDHGAGDVVDVTGLNGHPAQVLPFTAAVFPTINLSAGRIVMDVEAFEDAGDKP